jgi:capsular polysaccharide biosynthesis protein
LSPWTEEQDLCKHSVVEGSSDAPARELGDYVRPLRRRWWWVAIGVVLGVVVGLAAAEVTHRSYTSTSSVEVSPTGVEQAANNASGRTQDVINLDTEAQIVKSDLVAARVQRALHASASLAEIERRVSVTVPANTTVLRISYTAGSPGHAAAGTQAYATAYLAVRAATATRVLQNRKDAVRKQIASITDELTKQKSQPPAATPSERSLRALRYKVLASQSAALARQLSSLSTTVVTPGYVIGRATAPSTPAGRKFLFLLSAAMIGLLLGVCGAFVRDRKDTRLYEPRELEDAGIRVVGALDTPSDAMRTYTRAGNAVLRASPERGGVVLVAWPTWESREDEVAVNIASAIRDVAGKVALVSVGSGSAEVTQFQAHGSARVALDRVDSEIVSLRPSDPAQGARSTQLSTTLAVATRGDVRRVVERLKEEVDFVVVEAADPLAEAVLPVCDTALLVVSMNDTRITDVLDAVREIERSGVHVLGAVVAAAERRPAFGLKPWVLELRREGAAPAETEGLPSPQRTSSRA